MSGFKNFIKSARPALTITLELMLICGLIYPLFMTGVSQLFFNRSANGSLIELDGQIIGSEICGQDFTEDYYLKGRPSSVHYNSYFEDSEGNKFYSDGTEFTGISSGSYNYGPTNPALQERVSADMAEFLESNPEISQDEIPADLMTASGSGLDMDISPESARIQLPAISEASGLSMEELEEIVAQNTEGKLLGIFGKDRVNVLGVNIGIYEAMNNK